MRLAHTSTRLPCDNIPVETARRVDTHKDGDAHTIKELPTRGIQSFPVLYFFKSHERCCFTSLHSDSVTQSQENVSLQPKYMNLILPSSVKRSDV